MNDLTPLNLYLFFLYLFVPTHSIFIGTRKSSFQNSLFNTFFKFQFSHMSVIRCPAKLTHNIPAHQYCKNHAKPEEHMFIRAQAVQNCLEENWKRTIDDTEINDKNFAQVSAMDIPQPQKEKKLQEMSQSINQHTRFLRTKAKPCMFIKHAMIGKGGFASVFLVTDKRDGQFYAMKVMAKTQILENGLVPNIANEKEILSTLNSQYIVKMYASFQDPFNVYFLLEYLPGGDLRHLMDSVIFTERHIQFIIGELILALEEIHNQDVLHLDVKPGNILINSDGHLKLTDFGISVKIGQKPSTKGIINDMILKSRNKNAKRIATLDYMPPELGCNGELSPKTDLWSVGVIMFELLYGQLPFSKDVITDVILQGRNFEKFLVFPSSHIVSRNAILLITSLLRPVHLRPDIQEIKKDKFFNRFNFEEPSLNIPPLIPSIKRPLDLSHFAVKDMYNFDDVPQIENSEWANLAFLGLTYHKRPDALTDPGDL
ncbi:AGC family protein kinase [Tritrichomonas foetus]|uniref:non-specific serine/threonine protein kinase n=1 Tax=Tritrichomonas foetus TaxID=1144522 RepID=A0A1J4KGD4_9EUKA|nr:AGC family protein kinase [Tritrichomonas foetus]|eukprot:OHT10106.1 AGC family protein kinase [Tritrichomonas foetus]